MKARTVAALMADHERKAIAGRAPYFHTLKGGVKLQRHPPIVHPYSTSALSFLFINIIANALCDENFPSAANQRGITMMARIGVTEALRPGGADYLRRSLRLYSNTSSARTEAAFRGQRRT